MASCTTRSAATSSSRSKPVALLYEFDRTPCAGRARSRTHRDDEVFDDVRPVRPDVRAAVLTISSRPAPLLLLGHSSLAVAPAHARSVAHGSDMSLKRVCSYTAKATQRCLAGRLPFLRHTSACRVDRRQGPVNFSPPPPGLDGKDEQ